MIAPSRNWIATARRLHQVKVNEAWRTSHTSFSAWLKDEAAKLDVQPSVLWRDLGALEFYTSLGTDYLGLALPKLEDAGPKISPQHLELIEKISRAADREAVRELLQDGLLGRLSRSRLLNQWRIYRDKSCLAPRRGRGVSNRARVVKIGPNAGLTEASAVLLFLQSAPDWTGCPDPTLYRAFATPPAARNPNLSRMDVVVLCQPAQNQPIAVHGIEVKPAALANMGPAIATLYSGRDVFNYLWLAIATPTTLSDPEVRRTIALVPSQVGLLELSRSGVRVLQKAIENAGAQSGPVLAELLARR